jgi:Fe-S-cluster containining protein
MISYKEKGLQFMDINDLYQKVAEFEQNLSKDFTSKLQCKKGCNQCCYVDLGVFEIEAENIRNWFANLPKHEKQKIRSKLETPQQIKENFHGNNVSPCHFLRGEECVIYPVRPLICRTQGNALSFQQEGKNYLDICPLNTSAVEDMQRNDSLNLDLLNTILVQLNQEKGLEFNRVPLKDIF